MSELVEKIAAKERVRFSCCVDWMEEATAVKPPLNNTHLLRFCPVAEGKLGNAPDIWVFVLS